MSQLIKVAEAAKIIGVSRQTLENWGKDGIVKIHGNTRAHFIDSDTLAAIRDTAEECARSIMKIDELKGQLYRQEQEMRNKVHSLRHDIMFAERVGKFCHAEAFYLSIPDILHNLGVLNAREATVVKNIIQGYSLQEIAEQFHLTSERVRQIFKKAIRRSIALGELNEKIESAKEISIENERLKSKIKLQDARIHYLEDMMNIEHQDELDYMNQAILQCGFSARTVHCLSFLEVRTVGELLQISRGQLMCTRGCGIKSIQQIEDYLSSIGKHLKP